MFCGVGSCEATDDGAGGPESAVAKQLTMEAGVGRPTKGRPHCLRVGGGPADRREAGPPEEAGVGSCEATDDGGAAVHMLQSLEQVWG